MGQVDGVQGGHDSRVLHQPVGVTEVTHMQHHVLGVEKGGVAWGGLG